MGANAISSSGGSLREHRVAAGLSQQTLAEMVRCSISMIRLLESGYRPEHSEVFTRIAAVLYGDLADAVSSRKEDDRASTRSRPATSTADHRGHHASG